MDKELKHYLDGKFAEIAGKLAEVDAKVATKRDLERVETTLLTEFHKRPSPAEARARTHAATLRAIDLEMELLINRIKTLEDRP